MLRSVLRTLKSVVRLPLRYPIGYSSKALTFQGMERDDKMKLVGYCLQQSGFDEITFMTNHP